MSLEDAIRERRSIRRYSSQPVPDSLVREVLELARWSPSWANTQSWSVFVVRGAALVRLKDAYRVRAESKAERAFDLPAHSPDWPEAMKARTKQLIDARQAASSAPPASHTFFDAPCVVFLGIDPRLQPAYACFDCGLLAQTLCLAAHARGLGTCIMAMAVSWPDLLRELIPPARDKKLVVGLSLGFPELGDPINGFERRRAELDAFVSWVE